MGNSKGIGIPEDYLKALGNEVVLEKTKDGLIIRPAHEVVPLKDWISYLQPQTLHPKRNSQSGI